MNLQTPEGKDYLTVDAPIDDERKICCISFLGPNGQQRCNLIKFNLRGAFDTIEETDPFCNYLNRQRKRSKDNNRRADIYKIPMGVWVPWYPYKDQPENALNELNMLIKSIKVRQIKERIDYTKEAETRANIARKEGKRGLETMVIDEDEALQAKEENKALQAKEENKALQAKEENKALQAKEENKALRAKEEIDNEVLQAKEEIDNEALQAKEEIVESFNDKIKRDKEEIEEENKKQRKIQEEVREKLVQLTEIKKINRREKKQKEHIKNQPKGLSLKHDKPISGQKWVCVSFASSEDEDDMGVKGVKIRGVYENFEQAKERGTFLQTVDTYFDVITCPVGHWLDFNPNPDDIEDQVYDRDELNDFYKTKKAHAKKSKNLLSRVEAEEQDKILRESLEKDIERLTKNDTILDDDIILEDDEPEAQN
jgi:hypothetical protein